MARPFTFVCLNPRKTKRARIAAALGPLGTIEWRLLPKLGFSDWPETHARAETALLAMRSSYAQGLKRRALTALLRLQYNGTRRYFERHKDHIAVAWNGLNGSRRVYMDAAKDAGAKTLFFELGPFPDRITVDPAGVNYANSLPRVATPYKAWVAQSSKDTDAWRALGARIKQRMPDQPPAPTAELPPLSEPFVFAPLQVPGDSQLRLFGGQFRTVPAFVDALIVAAQALPDGWHLRLKEHPSTPAFVADMLRDVDAPIYLDNTTDTFAQVAASRGVVTINSSVGLEAMFFDKPVVACGQCFWAIPGMAATTPDQASLTDAMTKAADWSFDPDIRNAVMSFLDQVYYPAIDQTDGDTATQTILDRLQGTGPFATVQREREVTV
ncbi:capsular polysaccharide export protein [Yoonia maricola]|uniref:Capsular polysaccharide export protein n=1 Tax=Yoonia maricola TaxID=420999 RepID=A0A2M8W293_9RHOB|nr:capsular biosynthesis protein [Yoonia maricola]PJI85051.1 capsular polysaccharide export protein [Yoonia maricola]